MSQKRVQSSEKNKRDPFVLLLALLLILCAGYFLFLGLGAGDSEIAHVTSAPQTNSQEYQDKVNQHLKQTYTDIKLKEASTHFENLQNAPRLKNTEPSSTNLLNEDESIRFGGDPRLAELPEILGRDQAPVPADNADPASLVQRKLFEDEQAKKYDRAYKEAYAAQYIQNALKKGWVVKINDDFQIISIQPVKKKRLPSLFDNRQNPPGQAK